jgi:hypothetical protein
VVAVLAAAVGAGGLVESAGAQEKLSVSDAETIKTLLERQLGKRVTLTLPASPELTGVVVKVGGSVVHLSEIQGREFFDAVVALDRISAVLIRVRGR